MLLKLRRCDAIYRLAAGLWLAMTAAPATPRCRPVVRSMVGAAATAGARGSMLVRGLSASGSEALAGPRVLCGVHRSRVRHAAEKLGAARVDVVVRTPKRGKAACVQGGLIATVGEHPPDLTSITRLGYEKPCNISNW